MAIGTLLPAFEQSPSPPTFMFLNFAYAQIESLNSEDGGYKVKYLKKFENKKVFIDDGPDIVKISCKTI